MFLYNIFLFTCLSFVSESIHAHVYYTVVGHHEWLNSQPNLSFCAGSVLFKTTVASSGGVALDNKHQGTLFISCTTRRHH